jgi:FkbM family methyltransferase
MNIKSRVKELLGQYWIYRIRKLVGRNPEYHDPAQSDLQFYNSIINPGDLCFDIGANIGNKAAIFKALNAKVIAIEPQDECVKILKHRFGKSVTILQKGVGEKEGEMDFFISNSHTISSFSKDWIDTVKKTRFKEMEWNRKVTVPITTLDLLISTYGMPRFVKIDVEGYEWEVLKGLTQSVPTLCFEYTAPERLQIARTCLQHLASLYTNAECNYTAGEVLQFVLPDWITPEHMMNILAEREFEKGMFDKSRR